MSKPRTLVCLVAVLLCVIRVDASAQMVLVDNEYYVTELKPGKEFGVALTRGEHTRNWVHVTPTTRVARRRWLGAGRGFIDETISTDALWNVLRLGTKVRVHGGRNWDGSVNAKRIWL